MSNTIRYGNPAAVLAAPRQIWLATLGAAAMTREWAEKEAGTLFRSLVPDLADAFRPSVILLQAGCDAHVLDPLTHLRCTTGLYEQLVGIVGEVADRHCDGRIIATGGGGYAIYRVVPRAWTLVWAALSGRASPDDLPDDWLKSLRMESGREIPPFLRDPPDSFPPAPRRSAIEEMNRRTVAAVRRRVMPPLTGWGLAF